MYPEKTSPVQRLLESMTGISNKLISQNTGTFVKNLNIMDNPSSITIISKDLQQFYLPHNNKDKPFSFCSMNSYAAARSCKESLLQGKSYTINQPKKLILVDFRSLIMKKSQSFLTDCKDEILTSIIKKSELNRNNIANNLPKSLQKKKKTKSHRKRVICKKTNIKIRKKSKQWKKSQRKKRQTKIIYELRRKMNLKVNNSEDSMENDTVSDLTTDNSSLQNNKTNKNSTLVVCKENISNESYTQSDSSSSDESSDEDENSERDSSSSDEDSDSSEDKNSNDSFIVFDNENDDGNNDEKNISINSKDSDDSFIVFDTENDDDDNDETNASINSKDSVDGFIVFNNQNNYNEYKKNSVKNTDDSFIVLQNDHQRVFCQSSGKNDARKDEGRKTTKNNESGMMKKSKKAKVSFDLKPKVHLMIKWNFAYRKARPGPWEQAARDRERFARRVSDSCKVLDKVLLPAHRTRIFEERFQDTS